jgi:hypothetical protein
VHNFATMISLPSATNVKLEHQQEKGWRNVKPFGISRAFDFLNDKYGNLVSP